MKVSPQVVMTLRQIMLMSFDFFGIQYSFGLQQAAISPTFSFLNPDPSTLSYLNMAGPITGLIVWPPTGAMSSRTWIFELGRCHPYFLIGVIGCSLCLFLCPHVTAPWMAVLPLWLLNINNNTTTGPPRVFTTDIVPGHQRSIGSLTQSVFTGLGTTLANVSLYLLQQVGWLNRTPAAGILYWAFGSLYVSAVCSISSTPVTVLSTPEHEPPPEEIAAIKAQPNGPIRIIKNIGITIKEMPTPLWQFVSVYLFQWYALLAY